MAKGLTTSYLPLGAVGMRQSIADAFKDKVFYGGLTYNSHPMGCAAALATIAVYEEDGLIERAKAMGEVMKRHHADLYAKHPSLGAGRSIGLFGILELVRDRATVRADGALQRHQRRDEGHRQAPPATTACTRSCAGTRS